MFSKLRLAKGIKKISNMLKKFINKCSKVAIYLKKNIKEAWSLLFPTKKEVIEEKEEGLFSTLTGTFEDKSIWVN